MDSGGFCYYLKVMFPIFCQCGSADAREPIPVMMVWGPLLQADCVPLATLGC